MGRSARGIVMASRAGGGEETRSTQRQTVERARLLTVLRAARRVCIDGRRIGRGTYEIDPATWMKLLHAVDEAEGLIAYVDRQPGDAEAGGAIAGMREVYG